MFINARQFSLSCPIELRKSLLINFKCENDLSPVQLNWYCTFFKFQCVGALVLWGPWFSCSTLHHSKSGTVIHVFTVVHILKPFMFYEKTSYCQPAKLQAFLNRLNSNNSRCNTMFQDMCQDKTIITNNYICFVNYWLHVNYKFTAF